MFYLPQFAKPPVSDIGGQWNAATTKDAKGERKTDSFNEESEGAYHIQSIIIRLV